MNARDKDDSILEITKKESNYFQDGHDFPEIIFGLIAPIGVDLYEIYSLIEAALSTHKYQTKIISLMDIIKDIPKYKRELKGLEDDYYSYMNKKMDIGNEIRKEFDDKYLFSRLAISGILHEREINNHHLTSINDPDKKFLTLPKTAYIIRQLKKPEEVFLLRKVYGKGIYFISAFSSKENRTKKLSQQCSKSTVPSENHENNAKKLITRDEKEAGMGDHGQNLLDTFPKADFFINMDESEKTRKNELNRFIDLIFGMTITPTKDENGMFHAYASSLKSSSLARQVGVSITSEIGDIISIGTNEVPKFGGSHYWEEDNPRNREYDLGEDSNTKLKKSILIDIEKVLKENKILDESNNFLAKLEVKNLLLNRVEVGRTVHAEMDALMSATRIGISVKNCILYSTTFPCHDCTKHIVSSGIKQVYYIEPFPKSLTGTFYHDSVISLANSQVSKKIKKVIFSPFMGVSPLSYIDLFSMDHPLSKIDRKDEDGNAKKEIKETPRYGINPFGLPEKEKNELSLLNNAFKIDIFN